MLMKATCPDCGQKFEDPLLFWARTAMEHHRAEAHGSTKRERTVSGLDVAKLRNAIADWARSPATDRPSHGAEQVVWDRADLDRALRAQTLIMSEAELLVTHSVLRQRSFMGGTYTQDAKAVVAELARLTEGKPDSQPTETDHTDGSR